MVYDPLGDNKSSIQLIDRMGNDLSVVNDARVSYGKVKRLLDNNDIKLIDYLIKNKHFSPLRGVVFKFRVKAPLYICRQWWKHVIASNYCTEQLGWNEKSLRYTEISEQGDFYIPTVYRKQSTHNKQSSINPVRIQLISGCVYGFACQMSWYLYQLLLKFGVGREQARGVLPASVYSEFIWTVSLQALLNFVDLRDDKGAQYEIKAYTTYIKEVLEDCVPIVYAAWNKYSKLK